MARILALAVGLGSFAFYMAFFFFPEVYRRKSDFIWSGLGFLYALTLWFCAGRFTGAVMLGQMAAVPLLLYLGWETLTLRRQLTPAGQQTPVEGEQLKQNGLGALNRLLKRSPAPEVAVPTPETPESEIPVTQEETSPETPIPVGGEETVTESELSVEEFPVSEPEPAELPVSPEPESQPELEVAQGGAESKYEEIEEIEATEKIEGQGAIAPDAPDESTIESEPEPDQFEESSEPVVPPTPVPSSSPTPPQPKSKTLSGLFGFFDSLKSRFQKSKPSEMSSSDAETWTEEEPELSTPMPEASEAVTEEPVAEAPETPEAESVEETIAEAPETPEAESVEEPVAEAPETPEAESVEEPVAEAPEPPEAESAEEPVAEAPETPEPPSPEEAQAPEKQPTEETDAFVAPAEPETVPDEGIPSEELSEPENDEMPPPSGSDLPETVSESSEKTKEEGVESSIEAETESASETHEETEPESTDSQESKPSRSRSSRRKKRR